MEKDMKSTRSSNMLLAFITLIAIILLVALVGWWLLKPRAEIIQGQAEAEELRISGKVPGRVLEIRVEEGQWVNRGDTLILIDSPEVRAKLLQAQSAHDAARAQNSKANKGARTEQIAGAEALWEKAKAGLEIAEKSYKRLQNLFDQGVVSEQKRDEAYANYLAMRASEQAALAQYEQACNGAEQEDKLAAEALMRKAEGAIEEVESYLSETCLVAPMDGVVSEIYAKQGELVGTGSPLMNILDKTNSWVVFNVREDRLKDLQPGKEVSAYIPALDRDIDLAVYYMKDMGSYSTWKATKSTGEYDLKTFELRARPATAVPELYPGMSVIIR